MTTSPQCTDLRDVSLRCAACTMSQDAVHYEEGAFRASTAQPRVQPPEAPWLSAAHDFKVHHILPMVAASGPLEVRRKRIWFWLHRTRRA